MKRCWIASSVLVLAAGIAVSRAENAAPGLPAAGGFVEGKPLDVGDLPAQERGATNENFSPAVVLGPRLADGTRRLRWRGEVVGSRVQVEGLALGEPPLQPSHMTTQRVAYEGGRIFVKGVDFVKAKAVGKPVRVSGVLRLEPESRTNWGTVEKYYFIEAASLQVLDRVSDPVLSAPALR